MNRSREALSPRVSPEFYFSPKPYEECAVFGVVLPPQNKLEHTAANITFYGLYALQHRGQEASGITTSDGEMLRTHKKTGLVAQVYTDADVQSLTGHMALGHNRYGTFRKGTHDHVQPVRLPDSPIALAHNGNLPSTEKLEQFLLEHGIDPTNYNDSEMMTAAITYFYKIGMPLEEAVRLSLPLFTGAYSLLIMDGTTLVAVRDANGIRPLSIGTVAGGYTVASETCSFETIGATFLREVRPGEMAVITADGLESHQVQSSSQKLDIFEFVYFSRPDSEILGKSVYEVRQRAGQQLAREYPLDLDLVCPVPDSAIPFALGYAEQNGTRFGHGLTKNRYIHRTFIEPTDQWRRQSVQLKLNPVRPLIQGKRVGLVDDSLVRGTTAKQLVHLVREAGARSVHLLIASPPIKYPDFYGIDTPRQSELLAANMSIEEICRYVEADSLHYLSLPGLLSATELPLEMFCMPHFTGDYPIDIGAHRQEIAYR